MKVGDNVPGMQYMYILRVLYKYVLSHLQLVAVLIITRNIDVFFTFLSETYGRQGYLVGSRMHSVMLILKPLPQANTDRRPHPSSIPRCKLAFHSV
jgi:hypothetical protein